MSASWALPQGPGPFSPRVPADETRFKPVWKPGKGKRVPKEHAKGKTCRHLSELGRRVEEHAPRVGSAHLMESSHS